MARRNPSTGEVAVVTPAPRALWLTRWLKWFAGRAPLHAALIGLAAIWSIPTIALLISSFRDPGDVITSGWWNAVKSPLDFTLDNYDSVLSQQNMDQSFINSLIITVPSTFMVILVAALAAYAFAWMQFPFRNALFLLVVALLVVPVQMTLIPVLRLYVDVNDNFGFLNNDLPLLGGLLFGDSSYTGIRNRNNNICFNRMFDR